MQLCVQKHWVLGKSRVGRACALKQQKVRTRLWADVRIVSCFDYYFLHVDTPLPKESRALLKWKVCSLTPNIVKKCISRVGFTKITSEYNRGLSISAAPCILLLN